MYYSKFSSLTKIQENYGENFRAQRGMGFERKIHSQGIMTSLSHRDFTDSLLTQNFT